jgi:hypothetical protein
MPSARVLVRFPLHVILRVEAALASTIVLKTSENSQMIASGFAIFATPKLHGRQRRYNWPSELEAELSGSPWPSELEAELSAVLRHHPRTIAGT